MRRGVNFSDMLSIKEFTIRRRYIGQQPGMKSARGLAEKNADNPLVSRSFCSATGLCRNSSVRASRDTPRRVSPHCLENTRDGSILGEPNRRRPVLPVPAPPRRLAVRRAAPTRPWYVRVFDSTGLHLEKNIRYEYMYI